MKYLIKNINDFDSTEIEIFLQKCNKSELNYIEKIKNDKKRKQTIIGKMLLDILLKDEYNINYFNTNIKYNKNGKPFIDNSNIFFNISHSHDFVACIVSDNEIGIDIEKTKLLDENIINLFSSNSEKEAILASKKSYNKKFLQLYSLKEAYLKMNGDIISNINYVNFFYQNRKWYCSDKNVKLKLINDVKDYVIAICYKKKKSKNLF